MTAPLPATNRFEAARQRLVDGMPDHFERLTLGPGRLDVLQTQRLRSLLEVAVERSPFHAARLSGIDPASFELGELATLPVMTKAEMMADLDLVVTDRSITQRALDSHLHGLTGRPALYGERFVVLASGGSTGVRGLFAYDIEAAVEYISAVLRGGLQQLASAVGWPPHQPVPLAIVAAPVPIHATRILPALLEGTVADITYAPATLSIADIAQKVQDAQPTILVGYTSAIARLADCQRHGLIDIQPRVVIVTSEQLTSALADRIADGFGAPPVNSFGSSEGLIGSAPPGSESFTFASDLAIVEFVDRDHQPVPVGTPADHVLITALFNQTQPLIRYQLDDILTPASPDPEHGHQQATVDGRTDDYLELSGTPIHPIVLRSVLARQPRILEHQIRACDESITVDIVITTDPDLTQLERDLTQALAASGTQAAVNVRTVDAIRRDPRTGKAHTRS